MKKVINPSSLFDSTEFGFSQIVVAKPGKMVFVSGQVAWDEDRHIVGKDDLSMQTEKAIKNLSAAMHEVGGHLKDIVMLRIYILDNSIETTTIVGEILRNYFGSEHPPASTWLQVNGLANPDFLIEIEAQAVLSK